MAREIPLTKGQVAIVDDADYERLSQYRWRAIPHKNGRKFYAGRNYVNEDGAKRTMLLHREIMQPMPHTLLSGGIEVDHINGDSLDNRRSNLRLVTKSENYRGRTKTPGCSSQYKGVSLVKRTGRWQAYIRANDLIYRLGTFANEVDAARAYDAHARVLFGEFARLNLPDLPPIPLPRVSCIAKGTTGYKPASKRSRDNLPAHS
jgi:hypothetical protein